MPVRSYSSGMKARLAFGMSMGIHFDWYLVDEITAVGDAAFKKKSLSVFSHRLKDAGLLMVSHSVTPSAPTAPAAWCSRTAAPLLRRRRGGDRRARGATWPQPDGRPAVRAGSRTRRRSARSASRTTTRVSDPRSKTTSSPSSCPGRSPPRRWRSRSRAPRSGRSRPGSPDHVPAVAAVELEDVGCRCCARAQRAAGGLGDSPAMVRPRSASPRPLPHAQMPRRRRRRSVGRRTAMAIPPPTGDPPAWRTSS